MSTFNIDTGTLGRWALHVQATTGLPHDGSRWEPTDDEAEVVMRALAIANSGASLVNTDERAIAMCAFARSKAEEMGLSDG